MKTSIKNIASVIASIIWADGEYDEAEKVAVEEIAEAFEFDGDTFKAEVDNQVQAVAGLDEEKLNEYLQKAAEEVDDEEVAEVYEACIQMAISDNVLAHSEVETLLAIADALDIDATDAVILIADTVKTEPDLEISLED